MLQTSILVTGASGMLGHALMARLRDAGAEHVLAPSSRELDLCNTAAVHEYWRQHQPVTVFHLAGYVRGILGNMHAGFKAFLVNSQIQSNLLQAAIAHPPQSLVVAGTVAAYSYPYTQMPLREEDFWRGMPHSSEGPYALGKRVAIPYLEGLAIEGCGTRFAVLTNLFGAHDHFGEEGAHVVPSLVARFVDATATDRSDVTVWGKPETTRDFLWSVDAAQFLMDLARSAANDRGFALVNVASGAETSMGELAGLIAEEAGFRGSIRWDSSAPIGVHHRVLDVTRLHAMSRHRPSELRAALRATMQWYAEHGRGQEPVRPEGGSGIS
jgi:GDP-L-fucose synthase